MAVVSTASASLDSLELALNNIFMHTGSLFSEASDNDATTLARVSTRVKDAIPQAASDFLVALNELETQLNVATAILQRQRNLTYHAKYPSKTTLDRPSSPQTSPLKQTNSGPDKSTAAPNATAAESQGHEASTQPPNGDTKQDDVKASASSLQADDSGLFEEEVTKPTDAQMSMEQDNPHSQKTETETNTNNFTAPNDLDDSFGMSGNNENFGDDEINPDSTFNEFFDFDTSISGQDNSNADGTGSFDDSRFNDDFFNLDGI